MDKKKKRRIMRGSILALLAVAIVYAIVNSGGVGERNVLKIGDDAPNFSLVDLEGNTRTLSDYRGKGVFLNFWGTWCEPCKKEMPAMTRQYAVYEERGVEILAVNIEQSTFEVENFMRQHNLKFPVAIDTTGDVKYAYSIIHLPATILIDEFGVVTNIITGEMSEQQIAAHMESIKPGATTAQMSQR
ncbi:thiol-disulfide oxidoreductase ResA [Caryophanon latum]|uniref:Thiol-disulfide oxidoreductase n=1 Tax=Caryophanon latum TaxID=33977 RepID=A0A1C0YZ65_9BACL|nr:thiol-disulfide oxidoreductase ResA [Caryophanon latum]OCS92429.1 thiol-disulfide oxidoreductase [Caryophanon latum]